MPSAIFLDSGGVINDNAQRAPQWVQYLGEFLPTTILGGSARVWGQANTQIMGSFFSRWHEYMAQAIELATKAQAKALVEGQDPNLVRSGEDKTLNVYWIFERLQLVIWIQEMCRVAAPHVPGLESDILPKLTDEDFFQLGRSAHLYAITRVKADYPGAVDTIRLLSASRATRPDQAFKLCTSSGDSYEDLEYILKGLEVWECFDEIYGSDRVNCLKTSPQYYERVFARVGVCPVLRDDSGAAVEGQEGRDEVVVVDDSMKALKWARMLGARTVLIAEQEVDLSQEENSHIDYHLKALSELPGLLESWQAHLTGGQV
ncbi:hypothetical protein BGZ99_008418 [Dissophora globulifera]|uniref:HAD-like protein n=1 Tax=Dissophora globulifera TaxID=979702 RepID=A0A9P6RTZ9_9FUNG|nr:hypothetical protein BGZ99_008418 [Dissophora globulifera]